MADVHFYTQIIKSLFKGREDVFAIRWEKGSKAGYMPAYNYDPYQYSLHKRNGGTFSNFNGKTYKALTDYELQQHLVGKQFIGVYPLLKENTSWFLVADFDKKDWERQCIAFIEACHGKGIPAYLERSRSGNGGHVWIFFEENLPAYQTRKLFINILEESGLFSVFDRSSSFDRLFPNQDYLSGKGLGNLIALPLNGLVSKKGNGCFLDIQTLTPFKDQWGYLQSIDKLSTKLFKELYRQLGNSESKESTISSSVSNILTIQLSDHLYFNRSGLTPALISFLKEKLIFANPEFYIKQKQNRSTYKTERYYNFIEETDEVISIPRGMTGSVLKFCKQVSIPYIFNDERIKHPSLKYSCSLQLRSHQKLAISSIARKDFGVIVAPPGSGKTILGLKIIADRKQPALIVVHRKQLMDQWIERIDSFLGIHKSEIGKIGQGKAKVGKMVTVAMIQSLSKQVQKDDSVREAFGTIIIDECHHIPAKSFRDTIGRLNTYFFYGLTATAFRKFNEGRMIFMHLGEVITDIKAEQIEMHKDARIIIRNTELDVPFNSKTDQFETISKILVHDLARNQLIIRDVVKELTEGRRALILTERKEHINTLNQFLKHRFETVCLSGDDSPKERAAKWILLKEGNYQVLITTGQFFGEGSDLPNASCLFLVYPFSFKGKLIQYIGRIQRSEIVPIIYDYRDIKIDYLNRLFLKRNAYYQKIKKQLSLFDDQNQKKEQVSNYEIRKQIKVGFDELEFRYGTIAFQYVNRQTGELIEFEIENEMIRPEFSILKPYFETQLRLKKVTVDIYVEFEKDVLIAQDAQSADLKRINNDLIESVRFKFIQKDVIGRKYNPAQGEMIDLETISGNILSHKNEDELIEDLLKQQKVRHEKQIRYLLRNHQSNLLKIRFVLNPFSFVFLLEGEEQFHVVMETLDTEEATYIWHLNKINLHEELHLVNNDLTVIRNKGRQYFIKNAPAYFSRIIHDYGNDNKGFFMWKGLLEERLV